MCKLQEMLNKQRALITEYMVVYGLPPYPLTIDLKEHQEVARHLISSIIEELSEAYTPMDLFVSQLNSNDSDKPNSTLLYEINMELADSLHFFLELLIYCNITEDSLKEFSDKQLETLNFPELIGDNTWHNLFFEAHEFNHAEGVESRRNRAIVQTDYPFNGGTNLTSAVLEQAEKYLWQITHALNLAQNELKNKAWKQTEVKTDVNKFQVLVGRTFMVYICLLALLNHTPHSMYEVYLIKNKANLKRIKTKY